MNMLTKSVGLAIFAKTPSLSPVKTRLAASIGKEQAQAFYRLSVACIKEMVDTITQEGRVNITPYWALAEKNAIDLPCWQSFNRLWTGEGELGERLHTIYHCLHQRHTYVVMIGTDSPQLDKQFIYRAVILLALGQPQINTCVLGPCYDGGFYLFASSMSLKKTVWTQVNYSQNTTSYMLSQQLSTAYPDLNLHCLPIQGDIDRIEDVETLILALRNKHTLLPAQKMLYQFAIDCQTALDAHDTLKSLE